MRHALPRPGALSLVAALAGCTGGLDPYAEDTDRPAVDDTDAPDDTNDPVDTDEPADLERLQISGVSPPFGTNGGGYEITLRGGPFDLSASVVFVGEVESVEATVISATETEMIVEAPVSADTGEVDVRVTTDTHTGARPKGFVFYADGTGQYGVMGGIEWYDVLGDYWAEPPRDYGQAWMAFHEPMDAGYPEMYYHSSRNGDGGCSRDYLSTSLSDAAWADFDPMDPSAAQLKLGFPDQAPLVLRPSASDDDGDGVADIPWFYSADLMPADFAEQTTYNLLLVDGDGELPRFDVDALAVTPDPVEMISPDLAGGADGTVAPSVRRAMQLQWWPGTLTGSLMVASLYRHDLDTREVVETVSCVMRDDGSFTVPQTSWSDWQEGAQLTLVIGRVLESGATLPYNHADSGVVGAAFVVGAASAVP